eukprot:TRINITY_DN12847_c0_g3_i1.p1 TRINITY_DN12847_c0_g3~~TRINITY_DN12847_c0_g3_i1.p1  ORF type:complete len:146 (-),score=33.39 TRINITY_DN12847_c0_g3_i1:53-490(-)
MNLKDDTVYSYKLDRTFNYGFNVVATAYWSKYKKINKYASITIAEIQQLDKDRFVFVRRMDGRGKTAYERIVYDRRQPQILSDLFTSEEEGRSISERSTYSWDSANEAVNYTLFVVKEKLPRFIRSTIARWGMHRMERTLQKLTT